MMHFLKTFVFVLLFASARGVRCGNHYANGCSRCVFDFADDSPSSYKGAAWCHGDCVWEYDPKKNGVAGKRQEQCRFRQDSDVDCGYYAEVLQEEPVLGFFRPSCLECFAPTGQDTSGEKYCGGDCIMDNSSSGQDGDSENRCVPRL